MKILLCCWDSLCERGIKSAINNLGYELITFSQPYANVDYDTSYIKELANLIQNTPGINCVLTVNFLPIVARTCKVFKIPYLSWTADCPSLPLCSEALSYPTNHIFLFDRLQTEKFYEQNPGHVYYLPLGCDIEAMDSINVVPKDHETYDCDVSFIGTLYTEKCDYDLIKDKLPDYMKGYAEALIAAQQNVFGYNFIEDSISEEWAKDFQKYADYTIPPDYVEDIKGIVADHYLNYKCTAEERTHTIRTISEYFNMDLYTLSNTSSIPLVRNRGGADSGTMMPKIFKCSKINLNITLRSIKSGIPLRVFDILSAGGFLLSNYQPEIPEYFVPGEDLVLYDSIPDLLNKIDYYLTHEEERLQIAKSGYEKVKQHHTYAMKIQTMLKMSGLL